MFTLIHSEAASLPKIVYFPYFPDERIGTIYLESRIKASSPSNAGKTWTARGKYDNTIAEYLTNVSDSIL